LHEHLDAAETLGIDNSDTMLERAAAHSVQGLRFTLGDIATWEPEPVDLVFSNAALHWVPDHHALLRRLTRRLPHGGQLAVQVPANGDHPSHTVLTALAAEPPYADALAADPPPDPAKRVLLPEQYAELLDDLGFAEQHVHLRVYCHKLDSSADVIEWVKGTHLTQFKARLSIDLYEQLLVEYRQRLLDVIGDRRSYLYTFKRILFWARR
jgi:trans-aconitate 2-methyltransferase